ncbi:MAG: YjgN family protein, partial [Alphaproteobacteria bacterium]|nr:YjgN family protein [Alphaproteobacteria bacterium]
MADAVISSGTGGGSVGAQGERIVGFWGRRGPLFGILLVNALLGLVTLGIYRFWARTRLRQYFWNSIEIDGDLLEYTGRGLELFIGFLIVVAVLVPLFGGYSVLSTFLQATTPDVFAAVNFLYFITIFWLTRYAYFRARRYRLARTVWRGIRGGQDGSA